MKYSIETKIKVLEHLGYRIVESEEVIVTNYNHVEVENTYKVYDVFLDGKNMTEGLTWLHGTCRIEWVFRRELDKRLLLSLFGFRDSSLDEL